MHPAKGHQEGLRPAGPPGTVLPAELRRRLHDRCCCTVVSTVCRYQSRQSCSQVTGASLSPYCDFHVVRLDFSSTRRLVPTRTRTASRFPPASTPLPLGFTNPTINSYHHMVPGFEAPNKLAYSQRNRSAAVRIPTTDNNSNGCRTLQQVRTRIQRNEPVTPARVTGSVHVERRSDQ
ncbi:hypothetical protein EGT50_03245 [Rhodococcus xishaensis]|uniref:GS catalytic domain-containing protein n=1 Tax=Rhodococcus xishaensis TaxID=2487364 RepID=A0A438B3N6_9NOCA|nr:hypothetical protein EGT50_03245 [Rhodococcus xishaensis]